MHAAKSDNSGRRWRVLGHQVRPRHDDAGFLHRRSEEGDVMPKLNNPGHSTVTCYNFRVDPAPRPARAIRLRCLHCVGGERNEVRDCTATPAQCHLWPYRLGHGCDRSRNPRPPSRIKAMRAECVLCMGGNIQDPKDCEATHCFLWPYRTGHRPTPGRQSTGQRRGCRRPESTNAASAGVREGANGNRASCPPAGRDPATGRFQARGQDDSCGP